MIIKTENERRVLKEAGRRLAFVLDEVIKKVKPGIIEKELDEYAYKLITDKGDTPSFLGYSSSGAKNPYPATLCISVNDEVVHCVPTKYVFKEGDIVGLDIGLIHNKMIVDMAKTVPVGKIDRDAEKLINTTKRALEKGITAAKTGGHIGDISFAIEEGVKKDGFSVVKELGGHGVGADVHEDPFIPNFGKKGTGVELAQGMVLALEPIVNEGERNITSGRDGYAIKTKDKKRSAHFEHTIIVTKKGGEIVTIQ